MAGWRSDWRSDWRHEWRGYAIDDPTTFPGYGTTGPLLPVLLENGYTVTLNYRTDVVKTASGVESSRTAVLDSPKEQYAGQAILVGDVPVEIRTLMAEYAASGGQFLLPLPHEETTCSVSGTTATVPSTSRLDWINPGQRVVVTDDETFVLAVVQSATDTTIVLDTAPGISGRIMPVRQVLLEPQQEFPRWPVNAEAWSIQARAAIFGFATETASLALGPITDSAGLENATIVSRAFGKTPFVTMVDTGTPLAMSELPNAIIIVYDSGTTTITELHDLLQQATTVSPGGTWGSGTLQAGDAFNNQQLSGGTETGPVGRGATLTEYASLPVWDYSLVVEDTAADGVHAMTTIVDFGAVPYAIGESDQPDWYRSIRIEAGQHDDWQWLKLFLSTVKGRQGSFWLPTWRADLGYVSHVGADVTVTGEVSKWWPRHREHVQVVQADGTVTYAQITAVAGQVITLSESLSASAVEMISWLERCRFEQDEFQVVFGEQGFELDTVARVHRQGEVFPTVYELITIVRSDGVTYRHTSAAHDVVHDGQRYTAIPLERSEATITMPGEEKELTLTLPVDHGLARRWVQMSVPPKRVSVTITRLEDSTASTVWMGDITSMGVEGKLAKFRVPSRAGEWMLRLIPTRTVGRTCPVALYSDACGISESGSHNGLAHKVTTTAIAVAGRDVTVDLGSLDRNGDWAERGAIRHVTTGEIMAVTLQTDRAPGSSTVSVLRMQFPIVGLKAGDSIEVLAGCDKRMETCHTKFGNRQNFQGFHTLPTANPFVQDGAGSEAL